ncbi:unnamed protein product [Heligmosomoides polygyrus]|uniref:Endo/exonuclease/phosphatase domain-containing protein n=1 Tax=Heligmosomoides polygyrus TaxID=6339 RepID=A0A183G987_HELPZ|nr:unnamed protein product [Heligmosomoides polygyrus]
MVAMSVPSRGATGNCPPCELSRTRTFDCRRQALVTGRPTNTHATSHGVGQFKCFEIVLRRPLEPTSTRRARRVTRVATLNVGTLTGGSCEVVEALERRRVDFYAVQETRWSCRKSKDIGRGLKAVLCGSPRTTSGVGIIVSERFRDAIVSVERFDGRLMKIVVAAKERLHDFFSAHASQTGCSDQAKDEFWNLLDEKRVEVPSKDVIVVAGDFNGHVDRDQSLATDAKIVPYETVAPQHRPLICTLKIAPPRLKQVERCSAARIKWRRMKEKEAALIPSVRLSTVTAVDETWKKATDAIRQAAQSELGISKPGRRKVDK